MKKKAKQRRRRISDSLDERERGEMVLAVVVVPERWWRRWGRDQGGWREAKTTMTTDYDDDHCCWGRAGEKRQRSSHESVWWLWRPGRRRPDVLETTGDSRRNEVPREREEKRENPIRTTGTFYFSHSNIFRYIYSLQKQSGLVVANVVAVVVVVVAGDGGLWFVSVQVGVAFAGPCSG